MQIFWWNSFQLTTIGLQFNSQTAPRSSLTAIIVICLFKSRKTSQLNSLVVEQIHTIQQRIHMQIKGPSLACREGELPSNQDITANNLITL